MVIRKYNDINKILEMVSVWRLVLKHELVVKFEINMISFIVSRYVYANVKLTFNYTT